MVADNVDEQAAKYRELLIANKEEKNRIEEKMREGGRPKHEIAGIKLSVRQHFATPLTPAKMVYRKNVEAFAESLGQLQDTPLGRAAVRAVK